MPDPKDTGNTDEEYDAVDIYMGDNTVIIYDADGEQHVYTLDELE